MNQKHRKLSKKRLIITVTAIVLTIVIAVLGVVYIIKTETKPDPDSEIDLSQTPPQEELPFDGFDDEF